MLFMQSLIASAATLGSGTSSHGAADTARSQGHTSEPWDFVEGGRALNGASWVLAASEGCCMSRFRVNQDALSAALSGCAHPSSQNEMRR